jgi:ribosome-binding protein aMBF1 (putative translation factor)
LFVDKSKGSGCNKNNGGNSSSYKCKVCNKKIDKPAVQLHIDGSEVEVCPVCWKEIKK